MVLAPSHHPDHSLLQVRLTIQAVDEGAEAVNRLEAAPDSRVAVLE